MKGLCSGFLALFPLGKYFSDSNFAFYYGHVVFSKVSSFALICLLVCIVMTLARISVL